MINIYILIWQQLFRSRKTYPTFIYHMLEPIYANREILEFWVSQNLSLKLVLGFFGIFGIVNSHSALTFMLNEIRTINSSLAKDLYKSLRKRIEERRTVYSHTYITYIIGHYNPSVRIIDLVSHTTYVVCVNFIHKWRDLQFKVDSERQIFWESFHSNFIYSQSFCQKSAERKSPKKYFSYFVLMSSLGLEPWLFV